jgi:hypothetical protein
MILIGVGATIMVLNFAPLKDLVKSATVNLLYKT